jgi:hypothetical protein
MDMNWFGEPWPSAELRASVCEEDSLRVPLPPGEICALCGNPLEEDAQGVVIPHVAFRPGTTELESKLRYNHIDCLTRSIGA